jgi:UDP-GlcNAc:undecaprenyl-phosphate/decaprenyl-phosphate GlcNAc-1-phosphate transferase
MTQPFLTSVAVTGVSALAASVALTPAVRAMARRIGAVAKPKADRWHTKPTAMLGGVAIVLAVVGTLLALVPLTHENQIVVAASVALFLLGLTDDFFHIKPYQKLIGQLLGGAAVVSAGLVLPWTPYSAVNLLITLFWIVGITNAVNMLDNMDGLAAGVSAIAAAFLGMNFVVNQQWPEAVMLAAFAGALIGFLVYNHHPASIFMGDCGSMFVGFFLASSALVSGTGGGRSRSVVAVLAVPVLVLLVPIFDTTFVTLMRKMAGRSASQGGRDHTSHRLVALGLSEKRAVWMLYTFALAAGTLAMFVRHKNLEVSLGAIAAVTIVLTLIGLYLARVRVYDVEEEPELSFRAGDTPEG